MFPGKSRNAGQAGHSAVVIDQFAENAAGRQTGKTHHVNGGFGMSAPLQHAALSGAQREDMAGTTQIIRTGVLLDCSLDRRHAIRCGNAGCHPGSGFDADGKGRLLRIGIVRAHGRQLQSVGVALGQAQTDNAAAMADEAGHLRIGQAVGGIDEIAFVLAILVINHQDAPARTHGCQGAFHTRFPITKRSQDIGGLMHHRLRPGRAGRCASGHGCRARCGAAAKTVLFCAPHGRKTNRSLSSGLLPSAPGSHRYLLTRTTLHGTALAGSCGKPPSPPVGTCTPP